MESKNDSEFSSLQKTTIKLEGRDLVITLQDAEQLKNALASYLTTSKQLSDVPFLTKESEARVTGADDAWIDQDGQVRIGLWVLQTRGRNLILVYRATPPTTRVGYQYIAHLDRSDGHWKVSSITFEKLYYRQ